MARIRGVLLFCLQLTLVVTSEASKPYRPHQFNPRAFLDPKLVSTLHRLVSDRDRDGYIHSLNNNVLSSPFSFYTSIGMLMVGSRDETRHRLRRFFDCHTTRQVATMLEVEVISAPDFEPLHIVAANCLFIDRYPEGPAFENTLETLESEFGKGLEGTTYELIDGESERSVCEWLSDQSAGAIEIMNLPLQGESLVPAGIIQFFANWKQEFINVEDSYFTTADGTVLNDVQYMTATVEAFASKGYGKAYLKTAKYSVLVLEIPFQHPEVSMTIFQTQGDETLPILEWDWRKKPNLLNEFLDEMAIQKKISDRDNEALVVTMPKFMQSTMLDGSYVLEELFSKETDGGLSLQFENFHPHAKQSTLGEMPHIWTIHIDGRGGMPVTTKEVSSYDEVLVNSAFLFQIRVKSVKKATAREYDVILLQGRVSYPQVQ